MMNSLEREPLSVIFFAHPLIDGHGRGQLTARFAPLGVRSCCSLQYFAEHANLGLLLMGKPLLSPVM